MVHSRAFHLSPHCSDLCDPGFLGSCEFPSFRFQMLKIDENWDLTTKNYQKLWFEHVLTVLRRVFISKIQLPCKQLVIPGDLRNILGFNSRLKISSRGFGQINKMSSHVLERLERSMTCVQSFTKLFFHVEMSSLIFGFHCASNVRLHAVCFRLSKPQLPEAAIKSCPKLPSNWQSAEQLVRWKIKTDHFPSFLY